MLYNAELVVSEVDLQRVPVTIDYSHDIQSWGLDNLYPQRAAWTALRSYTTKTAVKRLAGFLYGGAFNNSALGNLVLNRKGMKGNQLLKLITQDYATHQGFALHVNYNMNWKVRSVRYVKVIFCRFGLPGPWQDVYDIKVCNNWEDSAFKNPLSHQRSIFQYPVFNPNPAVIKEEVKRYGGLSKYPGQIHFVTPEQWVYPEATFDSVFDYAQVQKELGEFDVSKIQNGLTATTVFKYPGVFDTEEDKEKFQRKLTPFKGARGANSTIVVENPSREDVSLTESLQLQNLDKLHTDLTKTAKDSIREAFSQPQEIHGTAPTSGMFNQEQIREAYNYYNTITQDDRDFISAAILPIFENWWQPVDLDTTIKQKVYASGQPTNQ